MSTENPDSESQIMSTQTEKLARQLLAELPAPVISARTKSDYGRTFQRLLRKSGSAAPDHLLAAAKDTSSPRTYYKRIAAIKYGLRNLAEKALDQNKPEVLGYLKSLHKLLNQQAGACPIASPKARHSKRQDLNGLPPTWRELMYAGFLKSKYRVPYLIMAITGCRVEELQSPGVMVSKSNDMLTFTITGAKVKDSQGQPIREISYPINDPHPLIQSLLADKEFKIDLIGVPSKENYTSAIRRVGRKLWARRKSEITPYCLRHAAASDFKDHLSPDEVSKALGHAVAATRSRYGQRQMSRSGGLKPSAVSASRPIKSTKAKFSKKPHRSV